MKKKILIPIIIGVIVLGIGAMTLIGKNQASKIDNNITKVAKVDYTGKTQIDKVRKEYDKSLFTAKWFVKKLDVLEKAEARIKKDQDKIVNVEKLIDKIGYDKKKEDSNITLKKQEVITNANMAYMELDDLLKKGVKNYNKLKKSLDILQDLTNIDITEKNIDKIGEVSYNNDCLVRINQAKETYNSLKEELKKRVKNYKKLTDAESRYAELEAEATKAQQKVKRSNYSGGSNSSGSASYPSGSNSSGSASYPSGNTPVQDGEGAIWGTPEENDAARRWQEAGGRLISG